MFKEQRTNCKMNIQFGDCQWFCLPADFWVWLWHILVFCNQNSTKDISVCVCVH